MSIFCSNICYFGDWAVVLTPIAHALLLAVIFGALVGLVTPRN